jgi:cellulose synthase operon protein B
MKFLRSLGLAALMALALPAAGAEAQQINILPDVGVLSPATDPTLDAPLVPEPPALQLRQAKEALAAAVRPTVVSPLRPVNGGVARDGVASFRGESPAIDFVLFLSRADLTQTGRDGETELLIWTRSSIQVLPERSEVRIFVNDEPLDVKEPESFDAFTEVAYSVPAGILTAGMNRVRIEMSQSHRIYCGPEADFALWTELDLGRSGVAMNMADPTADRDRFLAAVAADSAAGLPLEIRGDPELLEDAGGVIAQTAAALSDTLAGNPIAFATGTGPGLATAAAARARITMVSGPTSGITFRRGGGGAQVMLISIGEGAAPDAANIFPDPVATPQPVVLATGQEVPFSDFGVPAIQLSDRYMYHSYRFDLPPDWLVLTAQKARIKLDYAYAKGLPEKSMLLLQINGETIRLLPMTDEGGRLIKRFPIDFNASLLNAGPNVLGMEVLVPGDPAALPCPVGGGVLLEVRPTSTLDIPDTPRMRVPDMARAVLALSGESVVASPKTSANDALTLGTALGWAGRDSGVRLTLVDEKDVGAIPLGRVSIDRRFLTAILTPPERAPTPQADVGTMPDAAAPRAAAPTGPGWIEDEPGWRPDPSQVVGVVGTLWNWGQTTTAELARRIRETPGASLANWLATQEGQAVLVQLDPARPRELWLIKAPQMSYAELGAALAVARDNGQVPRGQVSVLGSDGWTSWAAPNQRPTVLEPVTLTNVRPILGNLASGSPDVFVTILLLLTLVSAVLALKFVISTRKKP